MVPTPIFAASASISAISASDRPGSCWRASAQRPFRHRAAGARAPSEPLPPAPRQQQGRARSAAPPSRRSPREPARQHRPRAERMSKTRPPLPASAAPRLCRAQACGRAEARTGIVQARAKRVRRRDQRAGQRSSPARPATIRAQAKARPTDIRAIEPAQRRRDIGQQAPPRWHIRQPEPRAPASRARPDRPAAPRHLGAVAGRARAACGSCRAAARRRARSRHAR